MILENLEKMFPKAHCELNFSSDFELLIAVVLSAQTTDKAVNKVTKDLFLRYPNPKLMSEAKIVDLENIIKTIGLYHNKAANIKSLSEMLILKFDGQIPRTREELMMLPGVGRKSANVVLATCYNIPAIAVDTHVKRVAIRLRLALKEDTILQIENKLMDFVPKEKWCQFHHQMIFLGRYICHSKNPECNKCLFKNYCRQ